MLGTSPSYDNVLTIFSPDGRLFQVEYAYEAVRRGTPILGLRCKDGVVLAAELRLHDLAERTMNDKLFEIDEAIGAAVSGLSADARTLVSHARVLAQIHRLTFDEAIPVSSLTKKLCDHIQSYTQQAGVRPFGVALLIAGIDTQPQVFITNPIGSFWSYKAHAVGMGVKPVIEVLEREYTPTLSVEAGLGVAVKALQQGASAPLTRETVDIVRITIAEKRFTRLDGKNVQDLIDQN